MGTYGSYTGKQKIESEQRAEFEKQLEKILYYGGMMRLEKVCLYDKEIILVQPLKVDSEKGVHFYYNYFEDDSWETAGYSAEEGEFWSNKIGWREFNRVITAIHFLCEMYDAGPGVVKIDNHIISDIRYIGWLNGILGTNFSMVKRSAIWKNIEHIALDRVGRYKKVFEFHDLVATIPKEIDINLILDDPEVEDLLNILLGTAEIPSRKKVAGNYMYEVHLFRDMVEEYIQSVGKDRALEQITHLLKMTRNERANIKSYKVGEIGAVARMSLSFPARAIAYLTTEICEMDFWEYWKDIYQEVYHDEEMKNYNAQNKEELALKIAEPLKTIRTSEFIAKDDDRLYWWDGTEEVILSEEMDKWLGELGEKYRQIIGKLDDMSLEERNIHKELVALMAEIDEYYKRIFSFYDMFYEFVENGNRKEYLAAIELLRQLSEENKNDETILNSDSSFTERLRASSRLRIKRFLSVMANKKLREKYFGF